MQVSLLIFILFYAGICDSLSVTIKLAQSAETIRLVVGAITVQTPDWVNVCLVVMQVKYYSDVTC